MGAAAGVTMSLSETTTSLEEVVLTDKPAADDAMAPGRSVSSGEEGDSGWSKIAIATAAPPMLLPVPAAADKADPAPLPVEQAIHHTVTLRTWETWSFEIGFPASFAARRRRRGPQSAANPCRGRCRHLRRKKSTAPD